jgi:hypothetical protein
MMRFDLFMIFDRCHVQCIRRMNHFELMIIMLDELNVSDSRHFSKQNSILNLRCLICNFDISDELVNYA